MIKAILVRTIFIISFSSIFFIAPSQQAWAEIELKDLQFITEENPPSNFKKNGKISGIAPELLSLIWQELGQKNLSIEILPWARGYLYLQTKPGTVLFSTTKTEKRDALGCKWAGPIKTNKVVLLARRASKIRIKTIEDARNYRIGSIIKDIGEHLLLNAGVPKTELLRVSSMKPLVRMLKRDRIQLAAKGWDNLMGALKDENYNLDEFEVAYVLKNSHQYFAFNKEIPDHIVAQFQKAIDKLKTRHLAILAKFL